VRQKNALEFSSAQNLNPQRDWMAGIPAAAAGTGALSATRSVCPVQGILDDVFRRLKRDGSGRLATYIPELGKGS
jgi:hypothetical protein